MERVQILMIYGVFSDKYTFNMKWYRLKLNIPPNVLKCQQIWFFEFPHFFVVTDSWIIY